MIAAASKVVEIPAGHTARRAQILDAAEVCFVRNGFHRTTMLDLARGAGISPGNFYRYFSSKEDIVLALAQRDRDRGAALVEEIGRTGDRRAVLLGVLARYAAELSRGTAVLRLDLWAEATRNPTIAAMRAEGDAEARAWLCEMFAAAATSQDCDPEALFDALDPLMKGIIINRALLADYDPTAAVNHLIGLIEAGLDGRMLRATDQGSGR